MKLRLSAFRLGLSVLALAGSASTVVPAYAQGEAATSTQAAAADPLEEAKKFDASAREAYKAGQYSEALELFRKARELSPRPGTTYNIARCHEKLSQYPEAITEYEQYARETTDPTEKADALSKAEFLKTKLPKTDTVESRYEARDKAGKDLYRKGDYEAAIEEFTAAFTIKETAGALYNIAKCYEKMGRYEESIDYFQRYLAKDPNATDKTDVEELIRRLKKSIRERFQELTIKSDPSGADIYLDDGSEGLKGQTPFTFKVTPGAHILILELNGYEQEKSELVMPDDKSLSLNFNLKKIEEVGFLDIKVSEPGARIFVDGAIIGLSPYKEPKAVKAGIHQVQVELVGFDRWTGEYEVSRDTTIVVNADLDEYDAPVKDSTLSAWGRNLMLIGIIGGGLGFAGPFAYQKVIVGRSYYDQVGPGTVSGQPFYRGPLGAEDPLKQESGELKTLQTVQLISLIAGSVFTVAGLTFYLYKWFRTVPPGPVTSMVAPQEERPVVEITGFGVATDGDASSVGIVGSF